MKPKKSSRAIVTTGKSSRANTNVKSSPALALDELRALRLRAQGLAPRLPRRSLLKAVRAVGGVNAQLVSAMALSLRARVEGLTWEALEASRVRRRALVRTWCMRGTLHLMAADDLDWMLAAIAPGVIGGGWRWLERRAGLTGERARRVLDSAYQVLRRDGPMPRRELMTAVSAEVGFDAQPAAAGAMLLNGVLGRVCFGPFQGAEPTYAALDTWLGRPLAPAGAADHVRMARRYLHGYGPATPRDLAAWWGLGLTAAKAAWAALGDELMEVTVEDRPMWLLAADAAAAMQAAATPEHTVRLLPAFDTYLLGYAEREFAVAKPYQKRIFHGGEIVPAVLVDGCAAGTWHYEQRAGQMRITVTPFARLSADARDLIGAEAEDVGRFYGARAVLSYSTQD